MVSVFGAIVQTHILAGGGIEGTRIDECLDGADACSGCKDEHRVEVRGRDVGHGEALAHDWADRHL